MTTAFFASWRCCCTNVQTNKDAITRRCPTHNQELLGPIEQVEINDSISIGIETKESK